MKGRIIAIGDIHGCHEEFAELLRRLKLTRADRLILLGDLINRGPDSRAVIDLARQHRAITLLGNHERRLLAFRRTGNRAYLKGPDAKTVRQLRASDWAYLRKMRLTYHARSLQTVLVHGGFLPDRPWSKQPAAVVTHIQVVDAAGRPRKRTECVGCPSWADFWVGPPFVIYGHTPGARIRRRQWSLGIDTGCASGGRLTAYILPEKRFLSVKARRRYHP